MRRLGKSRSWVGGGGGFSGRGGALMMRYYCSKAARHAQDVSLHTEEPQCVLIAEGAGSFPVAVMSVLLFSGSKVLSVFPNWMVSRCRIDN